MVRAIFVKPDRHVLIIAVRIVIAPVDRKNGDVGPRSCERGGTVAVVQIQIQNRNRFDFASAFERIGGDNQAVEAAKTFAMIGMRMMKSADQRSRDLVAQSLT